MTVFFLLVNQILGNVYLSQCQFIMVFVVQHIHQIGIEWVDVLQRRKHASERKKMPFSSVQLSNLKTF